MKDTKTVNANVYYTQEWAEALKTRPDLYEALRSNEAITPRFVEPYNDWVMEHDYKTPTRAQKLRFWLANRLDELRWWLEDMSYKLRGY